MVVVVVLTDFLMGKMQTSLPLMAVPLGAVPVGFVAFVLLGVGVVIGAAGSAIGLRRFLKV